MWYSHTKLLFDPKELYDTIILELPFIGNKIDWKNVDRKVFRKYNREYKRVNRISNKILKFNSN